MGRSESAFTLLEVMAAVAIVAIVFTTLARVASEGLRSEGTSRRRLEASLLADSVLAEIEMDLQAGELPEASEEESEDERFTIVVEVEPFDLAAAFPIAQANSESVAPLVSETLFGDPSRSPLQKIDVRVVWTEGIDELEVRRTTFGIDRSAIQALLSGSDAGLAVPGLENGI